MSTQHSRQSTHAFFREFRFCHSMKRNVLQQTVPENRLPQFMCCFVGQFAELVAFINGQNLTMLNGYQCGCSILHSHPVPVVVVHRPIFKKTNGLGDDGGANDDNDDDVWYERCIQRIIHSVVNLRGVNSFILCQEADPL